MEWNVIPELIINKTCPFSHTTGRYIPSQPLLATVSQWKITLISSFGFACLVFN